MSCPGCGAQVPEAPGPRHPYLRAAPGCWATYTGHVLEPGAPSWPGDVYVLQHPDGAAEDPRVRTAVAVHLLALCLTVEQGVPGDRLDTARARATRTVLPRLGRTTWPLLEAPTDRGRVTAADVAAGTQPGVWAEEVWAAWSAHHDLARRWSHLVLSG